MNTGSAKTFTSVLKQARLRASFSVKGLAKRVGYSRPHLSNIELGHRRCPSDLVPVLDKVLQADGELVDAWDAEEEMRRRDLFLAAPAAFGLMSGSALDTLDLHRRLLVRDGASSTHDLGDLDSVERQVHRAHLLYQKADYAAVAKMLAQLIATAEQFTTRTDELEKAHRLLAAANLVASKLAAKLGDGELAFVLADRSLAGARLAADGALVAVAGAQAAVSLAKNPDRLADAEAMAETSYDKLMNSRLVDAKHISAQGNLLLVSATIASRLGQRGAAEESLTRAAELGVTLGHDGNELWTAFGPTNVELCRIGVAVAFREPEKALNVAKLVETVRLPASLVSRRAQVHLDMAAAYHQTRDDTPAVLELVKAEQIAPQVIRMNHNAKRLLIDLTRRERKAVTPGLRPLARRAGVDL